MTKSNEISYQLAVMVKTGLDVYFSTSEIQGTGLFAAKDYKPDDKIELAAAPGGKDEWNNQIWNLTAAARYTNHQFDANATIKLEDGNFYLVAIKPIEQDEEITANYSDVTRKIGPKGVMHYQGSQVPVTDLKDYVERPKKRNATDSDG